MKDVLSHRGWVHVIVGGGDGTVMWVVEEAHNHKINTENMHIGMLPLGTGNDFSQSLGWGGRNPDPDVLIRDDCAVLKSMVTDWVGASSSKNDVWTVTLKVDDEDGVIYKKNHPLREGEHDIKELKTSMLLYCGIAKDAELAYNVELHRTKSQCLNKLVYIWQGILISLHFFCCVGQRVHRVLRGLYHGTNTQAPAIFEVGLRHRGPRLYSNPEMLLCLNINSYAGGAARDLWSSSWRCGTSQPLCADLLDAEQNPGDGQLEVLTLSRLLRAAMPTHRVLGGRRVFQGAPLHFEFKQRNYRDVETFFQVDGESYKLKNPISLTIEHRQQIRVLSKATLCLLVPLIMGSLRGPPIRGTHN
ncbi:DGK2 [Symbiodinium pilosum]|uniref:diacylglycerol kinase (ATP) n=1 Tax=Symbiodinium pilosum TaxID=2952 RepID=A0A812VF17_SYMPI|nr:DGK2 [Symbiodinium pilosum]